jgi:copper chaperone CopZ
MKRQRISIAGMSCAHCVAALRKELERLEGVTLHAVEIGSADISYDPARTGLGAITAAVLRAGYEVLAPRA